MDLLYLFNVLLRRLWILIIIPVIAGLLAFIITYSSDHKFKSTAQLSTGLTTKDNISLTEENFNFREVEIKFNNLMESITSDQVVSLVSYSLILHDLNSKNPFKVVPPEKRISEVWKSKESIENARETFQMKLKNMNMLLNFEPEEGALLQFLEDFGYDHISLKENLNVRRIDFTDFILISATSTDRKLSAYIVNTLSEQFIRYYNNYKLERSDESVIFFANLVEQKKNDLYEKSEILKNYKQSNKFFDVGLESQTQLEQITKYETQRDIEFGVVQSLQVSVRNLNNKLKEIQRSVNIEQQIRGINQNIINLKNRIKDLNERYIINGSNNKELSDSLNRLRSELQSEISLLSKYQQDQANQPSFSEIEIQLENKNLDLEIAEAKLASTEQTLQALRSKKADFAAKEAIISNLQREVDVASEEYLNAQERYNNSRNEALASGKGIRILMKGQPAINPESRKVFLSTIFAVIASLGLTVFSIILIDYLDLSLKTPERFKSSTKLKLAGTLNLIKFKNFDPTVLFESKNDQETFVFKNLLRKLRYEVEQSGQKTFLFTSTRVGAGKSFTLLSLAYSLSLIHKKILIIDTNFKNNFLTRHLKENHGKRNDIGVNSNIRYLDNNNIKLLANSDSNDQGIINKTRYKNIDIIGTIYSPLSPSELLYERDFESFVNQVGTHYDYIFLESAALNDFSDTKELLSFVDKVIPVFSAQDDLKQLDKESIYYFKELNGKLFGAVLNKVNLKDMEI